MSSIVHWPLAFISAAAVDVERDGDDAGGASLLCRLSTDDVASDAVDAEPWRSDALDAVCCGGAGGSGGTVYANQDQV